MPVRTVPHCIPATRAFTLIELLVVIAVLAILFAILIPTVSMVLTKSKTTASKRTISLVTSALQTYRHVVGSGLPMPQTGPAGHESRLSGYGDGTVGVNRLLDELTKYGDLPAHGDMVDNGTPETVAGTTRYRKRITDGWGNPLFYQIADPRTSASGDWKAVHDFWKTRGFSSKETKPYPVVYSLGTGTPSDTVGTVPGEWWTDVGDLIVVGNDG